MAAAEEDEDEDASFAELLWPEREDDDKIKELEGLLEDPGPAAAENDDDDDDDDDDDKDDVLPVAAAGSFAFVAVARAPRLKRLW